MLNATKLIPREKKKKKEKKLNQSGHFHFCLFFVSLKKITRLFIEIFEKDQYIKINYSGLFLF
jgi:hypothetical protein